MWFDRESDEEYNEIESKFLTDWDVCRRLAEARHILSEPFPYEAGEDGMDELERRFVILRYWSHPSWKAKP